MKVDSDATERYVNYAEEELIRLPNTASSQATLGQGMSVQSKVDASNKLALLCLLFFGVEVGLRAFRHLRKGALST